MRYFLLTEANPKTLKSQPHQWLTLILHLLPYTFSGHQVCPAARGCEHTCLAWSGRGPMPASLNARTRRTRLFFDNRAQFMALLVADITTARVVAELQGFQLAIRLNGTSDLPWEKIRTASHRNLMAQFPDVMFYDYTKIARRTVPANYHLTFSYDGHNHATAQRWLADGRTVAVIYPTADFPATEFDVPVIDGDAHDLRFLDPRPCVVGLREKTTRFPLQLVA
jgi:hypothetical protein